MVLNEHFQYGGSKAVHCCVTFSRVACRSQGSSIKNRLLRDILEYPSKGLQRLIEKTWLGVVISFLVQRRISKQGFEDI